MRVHMWLQYSFNCAIINASDLDAAAWLYKHTTLLGQPANPHWIWNCGTPHGASVDSDIAGADRTTSLEIVDELLPLILQACSLPNCMRTDEDRWEVMIVEFGRSGCDNVLRDD